MDIKHERTDRGFAKISFSDSDGIKCNIQMSHSAMMPKMWIGCAHPGAKIILPGMGWVDYDLAPGTSVNTRMHLTQSQVYDLLPTLTFFAEHGCLPAEYLRADPAKMIGALMGEKKKTHDEILSIGHQLSNAAFALKSDDRLDERTKDTLTRLQKQWDAAYSAWFRKPGKPKEKPTENDGTS